MLSLKNITKVYKTDAVCVEALRGISLDFRKSEFVSILGPSGCGKTTLLNLIGGLDRYTEGDLLIEGRSTKSFSSHDWDSYRNHSIGFVFQSYNLISHQTVLSNVELALTLSGVSKAERRRRAKEVLCKVGLEEQINKKPNQLSGGQMQRVAIARALVNDPEILLADEPTGALDSETSVQIMDLLKEISIDRLVIMVTHNPELADNYSTRIIKLLDGVVTDDSNPYKEENEALSETQTTKNSKYKKTSMSFITALSLSLNNLMTKKGRTALISFAGSIGIIGIALILSLSNGINSFINDVQRDTLSSYPIQIKSEDVNMSALIETLSGQDAKVKDRSGREPDRVYKNTIMYEMVNSMISSTAIKNDLSSFKEYLENNDTGIEEYVSAISYGYNIQPMIYSEPETGEIKRINPSTVFEALYGNDTQMASYQSMIESSGNYDIWSQLIPTQDGTGINQLLTDQYDVVYGRWPEAYNEVVIFVSENNELNDMVLYSLGVKDSNEIPVMFDKIMHGETLTVTEESWSYEELCSLEYSILLPTDLYNKNEETGVWEDMSENDTYLTIKINGANEYMSEKIKVVGIVKPNDTAIATVNSGAIGYLKSLTDHIMEGVQNSELAKTQTSEEIITAENNPYKQNPRVIGHKFNEVDVFTGNLFKDSVSEESQSVQSKAQEFKAFISNLNEEALADLYIKIASTPTDEVKQAARQEFLSQFTDRNALIEAIKSYLSGETGMNAEAINAFLAQKSDEELSEMINEFIDMKTEKEYPEKVAEELSAVPKAELAANLEAMIAASSDDQLSEMFDLFAPSEISESDLKTNLDKIELYTEDEPTTINIYAVSFEAKEAIARIIDDYNATKNTEAEKITYTDYIAIMMSSVSVIIDAISYVLIAFVSISLIVSSIMIGIITYISVLERTKEIGILRAMGASKKDVSHVFNAETVILGFSAGMIGIIMTVIINIPITLIIRSISGINGIAAILPLLGGVILIIISVILTFIAGLIPSKIAARKDPVVALRTE